MTVSGVQITARGTLVDRVLHRLGEGNADSLTLVREVLGLGRATKAVAERVAVALIGADPRVRRQQNGNWVLVRGDSDATRIADCTFAVIDVETTGGRSGKGDRITEIAIWTVAGGRVRRAFETLVNPKRPIPRFVSSLTNITDAMVREAPTFDDIADTVTDHLAGRIFVAHNARFDWAFLARELKRSRDVALSGPRLCTVQLTRRLVPGLRSRGLDSVAAYFGIEITGRHRAGGDAEATAHILTKLLDLAGERGIETVEELQNLGPRRVRRTALPTPMGEA
jgi:DNA polymerase-3 subunit epsilon